MLISLPKNSKVKTNMNISKVPRWLFKTSSRIIKHMNDDHSHSIVSTLNAQHGIKDKNIKTEKLAVNGYFLEFEKNCNSSEEYKIELIKHANKYINYRL